MKIMALLVCTLKKMKDKCHFVFMSLQHLTYKKKFIIAPTETVVMLCT